MTERNATTTQSGRMSWNGTPRLYGVASWVPRRSKAGHEDTKARRTDFSRQALRHPKAGHEDTKARRTDFSRHALRPTQELATKAPRAATKARRHEELR